MPLYDSQRTHHVRRTHQSKPVQTRPAQPRRSARLQRKRMRRQISEPAFYGLPIGDVVDTTLYHLHE